VEEPTDLALDMPSFRFAFILVGALGALSCGGADAGESTHDQTECKTPGVAHKRMFPALAFKLPVGMVQIPGDGSRFYVLEHAGTVVRVKNEPDPRQAPLLLDLRDRVHHDWEAGLLGMAFHPAFAQNGELYVAYTGYIDAAARKGFRWKLSRFVSKDGGATVDPASERVLIAFDKVNRDHNGGDVHFGPDGMLYVSTGDGGVQHDPDGNARNPNDLRGKVLRIDPNKRQGEAEYGIPADNPFAIGGGRPEVYAFGFRNPWRFSFDRKTGELWLGDVGQNAWEDIERVEKGQFYGWNVKEGLACHAQGPGCDGKNGGREPVWAFHHSPAAGGPPPYLSSLTGGYVYRGSAIAGLAGTYLFADFTTGSTYGLYKVKSGGKTKTKPLLVDQVGKISSFAEDVNGELYVLDYGLGRIYRLVPGKCATAPDANGRQYAFLSMDGIGDEESAREYYQAMGVPLELTLAEWVADRMGSLPVRSAYYQNNSDLGFFREMSCTETIGRGKGGCWVRNWRNAADKDDPAALDIGTVAMDVSADGYTRFYAFAPPQQKGGPAPLSTKAVLDSEGEKFLPQLCTPCHGGGYGGADNPDVAGLFREFEPDALLPVPGADIAGAEADWAALNAIARQANLALRSEAEGAVSGIDRARSAMVAYIDAMFEPGTSPPKLRSARDPAHLPPSWLEGASPTYRESKRRLWTELVNPYCQGCHRVSSRDFAAFANFEDLAAETGELPAVLGFVLEDPSDPKRAKLPFMPQAERMSLTLRADMAALTLVDDWVAQYANPIEPQCKVQFIVHGGDMTVVGQWVHILGNTDALGGWDGGLGGLKLDTAAGLWPTWKGARSLSQGKPIEYKAVVIENGNVIRWESGMNRFFTVPTGGASCKHVEEITFRK
jgi:glucose/arabinose dehydrogenase